MSDTFQIFNGQDYWKDRPGTCQFCTYAKPRFNAIEYGGEQLMDHWWCELHKHATVGHGCGSYMREPGIEG